MSHKFLVPVIDTDSLTISKPDGQPFSKKEIDDLTEQINDLTEEMIEWDFEFYVPKILTFRAKNYIIQKFEKDCKPGEDPVTVKGSALKSSKMEIAFKEFQQAVIQEMLGENKTYTPIYIKYVKEILEIKDMMRYSSKKTITKKIYESPRENEKKVLRAIEGTDYREGDKVHVFFMEDESLCLTENFKGQYHVNKMLKKLFKTTKIFENVLNCNELFLDFSLKRNKALLLDL